MDTVVKVMAFWTLWSLGPLLFGLFYNGKQTAIAFDQLFNSILGGMADETLSARCWRMQNRSCFWKALRIIVDLLALLFGDKNHCFESYLSELQRRQLPLEYGTAQLPHL